MLKLSLVGMVLNPVESHVNGLEPLLFDVSLARPTAVELSTRTGVGGQGWCNSLRVVQRIVASFVLTNNPPNLASAVEETTILRVLVVFSKGPL